MGIKQHPCCEKLKENSSLRNTTRRQVVAVNHISQQSDKLDNSNVVQAIFT